MCLIFLCSQPTHVDECVVCAYRVDSVINTALSGSSSCRSRGITSTFGSRLSQNVPLDVRENGNAWVRRLQACVSNTHLALRSILQRHRELHRHRCKNKTRFEKYALLRYSLFACHSGFGRLRERGILRGPSWYMGVKATTGEFIVGDNLGMWQMRSVKTLLEQRNRDNLSMLIGVFWTRRFQNNLGQTSLSHVVGENYLCSQLNSTQKKHVKALRCEICERLKRQTPARPTTAAQSPVPESGHYQ